MPPCFARLRRCCQSLVLLFFALLAMSPVAADPAGRVGRIAWLAGSVYLHQAQSGGSSAAMLNWPLTSGDVLSTGSGGRAEVQIGSTLLHLASATVLEFAQVDDQRVALRLLDGSVVARLASPEAALEFELATREGRFEVREPGRYRFDADRSSITAAAYRGGLRFRTADISLFISAGQSARIWNDGRTRHEISAPLNDEFAAWSAGRDRPSGTAGQLRYVSPEMTGAADLDAYGDWQETPAYGAVWFPRAVAADWAPYRAGRWVWVEPWGWTWVGEEAWGFAPFHYGRWAYLGGAWGWVPGHRAARPVYAPALVAWVGGARVAASAPIGARPAVGWFPLAPREVYIPSYHSSFRHLREVNSAHVTNHNHLTEISSNPEAVAARTQYANQRLPQALTAVPEEAMRQRRPVREVAIRPAEHAQWGSQPAQVRAPLEGFGRDDERRRAGRLPAPEERLQRPAGGLPPDGPGDRRGEARPAPITGGAAPVLPPGAEMRPPPGPASPPRNTGGSPSPLGPPLTSQLPAAGPAPIRTATPATTPVASPAVAPISPPAVATPPPGPMPPAVSSLPPPATRDALPQRQPVQQPVVQQPVQQPVSPRSEAERLGGRRPDARQPSAMPGLPMAPAASPVLPGERRDAAGLPQAVPVPERRERSAEVGGRPPPAAILDERDRRLASPALPPGSAPAMSPTERRPQVAPAPALPAPVQYPPAAPPQSVVLPQRVQPLPMEATRPATAARPTTPPAVQPAMQPAMQSPPRSAIPPATQPAVQPAMPPPPRPAVQPVLPERAVAAPARVDSPAQRSGGGERPPGAGRPDAKRGDAREDVGKRLPQQGAP